MRRSLFGIFALSECGNSSTENPASIKFIFDRGQFRRDDNDVGVERVDGLDITVDREASDQAPRSAPVQNSNERGEVAAAASRHCFKYFRGRHSVFIGDRVSARVEPGRLQVRPYVN